MPNRPSEVLDHLRRAIASPPNNLVLVDRTELRILMAYVRGLEDKFVTPLKDQYGQIIPDDLVLAPEGSSDDQPWDALSNHDVDAAVRAFMEVDWYDAPIPNHPGRYYLCVSQAAMRKVGWEDECALLNDVAGQSYADGDILRIDQPLKRWNRTDGFYHA